MEPRLKNLATLDARAVPLPHGTEVEEPPNEAWLLATRKARL